MAEVSQISFMPRIIGMRKKIGLQELFKISGNIHGDYAIILRTKLINPNFINIELYK